jgi:hypothetical protein
MFLFELTGPDPKVVQLIAITNQLKDSIDNGEEDPNWTTDELLRYFQLHGINIDVNDLRNMIKQPPMSNIIANIQGDQVIFKGQDDDSEDSEDQDEDQAIVAQMAQSAMPT